jgi:acetylglutamate kinase
MNPITVVKIGGSTLGQHDTTLDDLAALYRDGERLVVVHGGGATITEWLAMHGVESRFVRGLRATDAAALDVVVAVLAGLVNKQLVAELLSRGAPAIGITGADDALVRARRYDHELGLVGQLTTIDAEALTELADGGIVVLAPIAVESEGEALRAQLLNVNADTMAGAVAAALKASRLVFLTDVDGVLDAGGALVDELTPEGARELIASGAVEGGMTPKVEAACQAAAAGVSARIVDGREAGALARAVDGYGGTAIG